MTATAVTNEGKTFPVAFSFIPGETIEAYTFFFQSLRENVFTGDCPEPAVVLTDAAAGMMSAVTKGAITNSQFQLYIWHVTEVILTWIKKKRYTHEEIKGTEKELGLHDLIWDYLKSSTLQELTVNRIALVNKLNIEDRPYILEHWQLLEHLCISVYTSRYRNLGATATQRGESWHVTIHQVVDGQDSLETSTKKLAAKVERVYLELVEAEDEATRMTELALDKIAFKQLIY